MRQIPVIREQYMGGWCYRLYMSVNTETGIRDWISHPATSEDRDRLIIMGYEQLVSACQV